MATRGRKLFPTFERPMRYTSRYKAALNMLVEVASTMWPGSEFHASITRLKKKCRLSSNLALGFSSLSVHVSS